MAGDFGALEWSPCEQKLLFVAEKKVPKSDPFYKPSAQDSGSNKDSETSEKKTPKVSQVLNLYCLILVVVVVVD